MPGASRGRRSDATDGRDLATPVVPAKVRLPRLRALPRDRVDALFARAWQHRLVLVIAPAGSGKTTLLAQFSETARVPVAWYRAETWDSREAALLRHLETAFAAVIDDLPRGWRSVDDAARALDAWPGERALLVVDDLHTLADSPAEAALERLIDYAPPSITILVASRSLPGFNLSRMRVSGDLMELGADDLRFRSWEVERLFRDFYREPIPPEELAVLARRTNGWAAGLQLFHLATRDRGADERRRILATLGPGSRLAREYLARNVIDQLSSDLRRFLVDSSPLGCLTGPLCDRFLGRQDSRSVLEYLERHQIFTSAQEDGSYRYHEVLRSHLEGVLVDELGEPAVRARYARAGALLEGAGAYPEALAAYCRAEEQQAVHRLLGRQGEQLVDRRGSWIDAVPPALLRHDPWVMLATARRHRDDGRWQEAVDVYARAEAAFGSSETAAACARERAALQAWLDPAPPHGAADWSALIRQATTREPMAVRRAAEGLPAHQRWLTVGLARMLAGEFGEARPSLELAAVDPASSVQVAAAARLAAGIAAFFAEGSAAAAELRSASQAAQELGVAWLARLGRAAEILTSEDAAREVAPLLAECARSGDRWTAALVRLLEGWSGIYAAESPASALEEAARSFREVGAGVLETWAHALLALALARSGAAEARMAAIQAEGMARYSGASGARLFCYLALAEAEPERAAEYEALADDVRDEAGVTLPDRRPEPERQGADRTSLRSGIDAGVLVSCLGGFSITIDNRRIDLGTVKPRARALLHLLALDPGTPIHREVLQESLWPDVDDEAGKRNLHVAISALRQALEPGVGRGASSYLQREGDAYRLSLPPGSHLDVADFERALADGRVARQQGNIDAGRRAFAEAMRLYVGDLLPEDGPAEWVVGRRERSRQGFVEAAQAVAELALLREEPLAAMDACAAGLRVDRFHDPLWRLLIEARERAGDPAAANQARSGYARMLAELGIAPSHEDRAGARDAGGDDSIRG